MKQEQIEKLKFAVNKAKNRLAELHDETRDLNDTIYGMMRMMEELEKFINENQD